jgi:hypothetical protein
MLVNSGDEGGCRKTTLFLCPNFLGSDPIRDIVWQNVLHKTK